MYTVTGEKWIWLGCALSIVLAAAVVRAADHDDTPALKAIPRHDARITDLHVFTRAQASRSRHHPWPEKLVIAVGTNPTIPTTAATYTFPSDLTLKVLIDRHSAVDFAVDPEATATFGGTIGDPGGVKADIIFTITFDNAGVPRLTTASIEDDVRGMLFAGLRDDPFIRGPRQGRNVASVVIEVALKAVTGGGSRHRTLLVWATSTVPAPGGPIGDLGARALRSQFAENLALNDNPNPSQHYTVLGVVPDVVIFDTTRPAAYPNGRALTDDVVDLVADPRILTTDCPVPGNPVLCNPTANDLTFLETFPYLAPPQGAAAGNPGVTLAFGEQDDDR